MLYYVLYEKGTSVEVFYLLTPQSIFQCFLFYSFLTKTLHHQPLKGTFHDLQHSRFSTEMTLKTGFKQDRRQLL